MSLTTLCYIKKNGKYLMLHRNRKQNDINREKWIGVGGHFEAGESPEDCLIREVMEETGLLLTSFSFRAMVTFLADDMEAEYMCLYTADEFEGTLTECEEGELKWVPEEEVLNLNLWDGDRIFLRLLEENTPFFSLKLVYRQGSLRECFLNGISMELFDIRLPDGRTTGKVKERTMVHRDGDLHGTSHVWVVRYGENGKMEVLLQKRARGKDSFPGCYDISSAGHLLAGAEFLESAVRELKEELGIEIEPEKLHYIGMHNGYMETEFYGCPFCNREISAVYVYEWEEELDIRMLTLQKEEVEEVIWMDFNECLKRVREGTMDHCIFEDELLMLEKECAERNGTR